MAMLAPSVSFKELDCVFARISHTGLSFVIWMSVISTLFASTILNNDLFVIVAGVG